MALPKQLTKIARPSTLIKRRHLSLDNNPGIFSKTSQMSFLVLQQSKSLATGKLLTGLDAPLSNTFNNLILRYSSMNSDDDIDDSDEAEDVESDDDYYTEEQIRSGVLEHALKFVPTHGWTNDAIVAALEKLEYPGVAHGMFPGGAADLVNYFYAQCNARLREELEAQAEYATAMASSETEAQSELINDSPEQGLEMPYEVKDPADGTDVMGILNSPLGEKAEDSAGTTSTPKASTPSKTEFIRDALKRRLEMTLEVKDTWPDAMAVLISPSGAKAALGNLYSLTDDIIHFSGDRSLNASFYTKRAAVAAVYKATELFMMQDSSPDHSDTWAFLDRRMEEIDSWSLVVGPGDASNCEAIKAMSTSFSGLAKTAINLVGIK